MAVKLGDVAGVLAHAKGLLNALRVGRHVTITPETLKAISRDEIRMADMHTHAAALEDFVRQLGNSDIEVK